MWERALLMWLHDVSCNPHKKKRESEGEQASEFEPTISVPRNLGHAMWEMLGMNSHKFLHVKMVQL